MINIRPSSTPKIEKERERDREKFGENNGSSNIYACPFTMSKKKKIKNILRQIIHAK